MKQNNFDKDEHVPAGVKIIIRHCACGRILSTADIVEGRPCDVCRERKNLSIPPLEKHSRKPNPARNIWAERNAE